MTSISIFVDPEYLTVSSSGPAEKVQYYSMGVFRLTGETHNNKPVWSRHEGTMKLFYDNGKGKQTQALTTISIDWSVITQSAIRMFQFFFFQINISCFMLKFSIMRLLVMIVIQGAAG